MHIIDIHAHITPENCLNAMRQGQGYYARHSPITPEITAGFVLHWGRLAIPEISGKQSPNPGNTAT